jgi:uncharacterized membrane protein
MTSQREQALRQIVAIARRYRLEAADIAAALDQVTHAQPEARSSGVMARVLAYLGGILVLAGIALFISMQWDGFTSPVRVLVTLGTGFAIYVFALITMADSRFERVTTPMLLVSALLQSTGIVVMLNEYSVGGDPRHGLLFMCVVLLVQQLLTFLARPRGVLLFMSLFFGAAGFGLLTDIVSVPYEYAALALGTVLGIVSCAVDRTPHRAITPFWYFAGSVLFLSGAFELVENTPFEVFFFGLAAGAMYLATVVRSRTLLFVSVIALTGFTGYFFRDSLVSAFGLIIMGLLLIGLSAFAVNLSRRYIRGGRTVKN